MLFNSVDFLFVFLPVTVIVYFFLNKRHLTQAAALWLVAVSVFFCGYLSVENVKIMMISVVVNYIMTHLIRRFSAKKFWLVSGIVFNICFLGYYKYANFIIDNVNSIFTTDITLRKIFLPLAISFFTFQQIAYLVDTYKGDTEEYGIIDYLLFVTFFPKLVAGPLVYHKDFLPQFKNMRNRLPDWKNIYKGLLLFAMGLFKKVIIADRLGEVVAKGLAAQNMTMIDSWQTSLSYMFQLYFDFSGYCDMGMGAALMLNIMLPVNFNSPYKAASIQDFWHRWHITLSRWLMMYIYIPLGGNRKGVFRTYLNLFAVFLIGGFWHGAGWPFIIWGMLNGAAMVIHRIWHNRGYEMPHWCGYAVTIVFVNLAWIFFRAQDVSSAWDLTRHLVDFSSFSFAQLPVLAESVFWLLFTKYCINSITLADKLTESRSRWGIVLAAVSVLVYVMNANQAAEFIYANF